MNMNEMNEMQKLEMVWAVVVQIITNFWMLAVFGAAVCVWIGAMEIREHLKQQKTLFSKLSLYIRQIHQG
jgi:hypothetical protein